MRIHRIECQLAITISWQTFLVCVDVGLTVAFIVYFQNSFSWPSPPTREGLENLAFRLKFSRNWQKSEQEADPQISPLHFKCKKSNHPFFPIGSCQSVRFSFSFFKSRARDSTTRFVHRSVGRLVGQSLLLPKWSSDLKYCPCAPARDFGSRVSDLVIIKLCKSLGAYRHLSTHLWNCFGM